MAIPTRDEVPPIIFADGALSQTYAPGISKFWFYRIDVDPNAEVPAETTPVLQVIMPADQFVSMVAFFERRLELMIRDGIVTEALLEEARKSFEPQE
jgi:hypothetical protein